MLVAERRLPNLLSTQPPPFSSSPPPLIAPTPRRPQAVSENATASSSSPIRRPPSRTERRFQCDHPGCDKAYFKPSRLAEHQLTHSGARPHQCPHCPQSYLRASHLTAHLRTHLSTSDRPFGCTRPGCDKRFWTSTHLKRHEKLHDEVPTYKCEHCDESFHKSHYLRDHVILIHMPPGTKPYPCPCDGCEWSFTTKQQLKTHEKTHDPTRYTCSHPSHGESFPAFPTWSALQTHLHAAHPPICPHPECHGRIFKSTSRLKDHLKVHEEQRMDSANILAEKVVTESESEAIDHRESVREKKRRMSAVDERGRNKLRRMSEGISGKEHACSHEGCTKSFKTKFALSSHVKATHTGIRYPCPRDGCDRHFAHKSTLSRHHVAHDAAADHVKAEETDEDVVGMITGGRMAQLRFACPITTILDNSAPCKERYNRVYDVRRHLKGAHQIEMTDVEVRGVLTQATK